MGFSVSFTGCVKRSKECWNETHIINASAPAAKTKRKPAGVIRGEREHLLRSEQDKADTQAYDAGRRSRPSLDCAAMGAILSLVRTGKAQPQ
jgi:hypothetical protein